MLISILTLFPNMFKGPFDESIVKRAVEKGYINIEFINIRNFGIGRHKMVDDMAYGGGVGMLMRVDVVHQAIQYTMSQHPDVKKRMIILTSAKGETYTQNHAREYAHLEHLIIVCGHYEGIDERILKFIDKEISIGNYVLTGGEIPAMVITDSVARLIEGVLKPQATMHESFSLTDPKNHEQLLEYPQYTRPPEYQGKKVPDVLLSGNHAQIAKWREEQSQQTKRAE